MCHRIVRALLLVRVRSAFLTDIPFNSFDHNSPAITTKSSSPSSTRRPLKDSTSRLCDLLWLDAVLEVGSPSTIHGCDPSVSCQLLAKLYASNSCFLASSMTHCSFDLPQVLRDCPTTGAGFKSRTVNSWRRLVVPHNLKHRGRLDSLFASTALRRRRSDLERAQEKKGLLSTGSLDSVFLAAPNPSFYPLFVFHKLRLLYPDVQGVQKHTEAVAD